MHLKWNLFVTFVEFHSRTFFWTEGENMCGQFDEESLLSGSKHEAVFSSLNITSSSALLTHLL